MASSSSFTSPSDTDLIIRYFIYRFCVSARKCIGDRYFKANLVYLVYSCLLLHIDLNIGRESASDTMYILLGYIHILNAILYIWMWSEIRSVWHPYILPDWLNVFGSFLYWLSASQYTYRQQNSLLVARRIELFASCVEMLATAGWCTQWYWEYYMDLANIPTCCVGRGFTLDDPDVWGLLTLAIATSYYLKYNAVMYFNLEEEAPSSLYLCGDCWYVVNAMVYCVCSMRDSECFWFMPSNGKPQDFLETARAHYFSSSSESKDCLVMGDGTGGGTVAGGESSGSKGMKGRNSPKKGSGSGSGVGLMVCPDVCSELNTPLGEEGAREKERERDREGAMDRAFLSSGTASLRSNSSSKDGGTGLFSVSFTTAARRNE